LAAYQKFTDEMVAKYGQDPGTVTDNSGADTVTTKLDDQVTASSITTDHDSSDDFSSDDVATITQVIAWLDALYSESLKVDHESDVDLMLACQNNIDACEDPQEDPGLGAQCTGGTCEGQIQYTNIGSQCQRPSSISWSTTGPTFDSTAKTVTYSSSSPDQQGAVTAAGFQPNANFRTTSPGGGYFPWTNAASKWVNVHNLCHQHKNCRTEHQQSECLAQYTDCLAYDNYRTNTNYAFPSCALQTDTSNPAAADAGKDLRNSYIQQEWWFTERTTMESCLDDVAEWFSGTDASGSTNTVGETGIWWKYQSCNEELQHCAEATLTCDDIQHDFEYAACEWTHSRHQSCQNHKTCYTQQIDQCAANCKIIQQRVVGRKAEYEIIQRIQCMLRALLANNDQHLGVDDDGTSNADTDNKTQRLERCKAMGDYEDSGNKMLTYGLDQLNITCQGPKKKDLSASPSEWKIDLDENCVTSINCASSEEEFSTGIYSRWKPGWRTSDYLAWSDEFPRHTYTPTTCAHDDTKSNDCADTTSGRRFVQAAEEEDPAVSAYSGATKERLAGWGGARQHNHNSKSVSSGGTSNMVHRKSKTYQNWGFDCSVAYKPCSHFFLKTEYKFLHTLTHAERTPCTKCTEDFDDSSTTLDDPCAYSTIAGHIRTFSSTSTTLESTTRFYSHRDATSANLTGQMWADLDSSDSGSGRDSVQNHCQCFHSRDSNFCTNLNPSSGESCYDYCTASSHAALRNLWNAAS